MVRALVWFPLRVPLTAALVARAIVLLSIISSCASGVAVEYSSLRTVAIGGWWWDTPDPDLFAEIYLPSIDNAGYAAFRAMSVSRRHNVQAEFDNQGPQYLVGVGDVAPGTNAEFFRFAGLRKDKSGRVAFYSQLIGPEVNESNDTVLWISGPDGQPRQLFREGQIAPGLADKRFGPAAYAIDPAQVSDITGTAALALNAKGKAVVRIPLLSNDGTPQLGDSLWSDSGGTGLRLIVRTGMEAPGFGGNAEFYTLSIPYESFGVTINGAGATAFASTITGAAFDDTRNSGVWKYLPDSGLSLIARAGVHAPGAAATEQFFSFLPPRINDAGQTVFLARLRDSTSDDRTAIGIWTDDEQGLSLVARTGAAAPGASDAIFQSFGFYSEDAAIVNGQGRIAFMASLAGPGVTPENSSGIWAEDADGTLRLVARSGDPAPGGGIFPFFEPYYSRLLMNAEGQIAFASGGGIWATDRAGLLHSIIQPGDLLPGPYGYSGGQAQVVASSGGQDGFPPSFNDRGQIVLWSDDRVFVSNLVAVPEPGSAVLLLLRGIAGSGRFLRRRI